MRGESSTISDVQRRANVKGKLTLMTKAAKCMRKTYPQLDEATSLVKNLHILELKSPVLLQHHSLQILYQVVEGKRRNQILAEITMYSKRN